ncbi:MAG: ribulose-phosphate 3-epimerase [Bdellovibrionales bacterium]|nr:ribulose-phosphate 3-epimerase [Bdellovibrionales bacterium]
MLKFKKSPKYISPSILSANFADLQTDIKNVETAGADMLHIDVMDGHFVPNITIGPVVLNSIKNVTKLPLDTHLMITDPDKYAEAFIKAGSQYLTFHIEACKSPGALIEKIKNLGAKPGLSLRPGTHIKDIIPFLPEIDLVLVMTVEPGFGGQSFMADQVNKIKELDALRKTHGFKFLISVDGGINAETAKVCVEAGADILVAGSYVFGNNPASAIKNLRML